ETAGKRGYRILEAEKLAEASRIAVYESAWRVRGELRGALVAYWSAVHQQELLQTESGIRAELADLYRKRVELGDASNPELSAARAEQASLAVSLRSVEGEVARGRAAIAEAAGLPLAALEGKSIDVTSFQNPARPDALPLPQVEKAGLLHRADIRRTLLEYEAADARLRLALASQYPNITLSPSWSFQEGFPAYTLGSVLESLPVFHRSQGPIAEQEAARRQVEAQFKALQARVLGDTQNALLQYRAAMQEWLAARDTFLPAQRQREAAVLASFRAGESDRLDVTQSRLLTLTAQKTQADALSRVQTALGALEDAMQSPLQDAFPAPRPETIH
ncbi:MAG: TolC family protein, partial [Acidobacteriota bacterium]